MIPKIQFYLWVVQGPFGIHLGLFQTYGAALQYVCKDARSNRIIEKELYKYDKGVKIEITFEDNDRCYTIERLLYTYDRNEPLITPRDIEAAEDIEDYINYIHKIGE